MLPTSFSSRQMFVFYAIVEYAACNFMMRIERRVDAAKAVAVQKIERRKRERKETNAEIRKKKSQREQAVKIAKEQGGSAALLSRLSRWLFH